MSKHDAPGRSVRDTLKGVKVISDVVVNDWQGNVGKLSPDAARIVACVNACAGLNPDVIPELVKAADAFMLRLGSMTTDEFRLGGEKVQREALESALSKIRGAKQ